MFTPSEFLTPIRSMVDMCGKVSHGNEEDQSFLGV